MHVMRQEMLHSGNLEIVEECYEKLSRILPLEAQACSQSPLACVACGVADVISIEEGSD